MKNLKTVRSAPPPALRQAGRAPAGTSAKHTTRRGRSSAGSSRSTHASRPRSRAAAAPTPKTSAPDAHRPAETAEVLRELKAIRAAVEPKRRPAPADEPGLESAVDSMRRLLSELLERDHEAILRELAALRLTLADPQPGDSPAALARIDRLMDQLGATPYSAQKLDFVDPAIHDVKAERHVAGMPAGVVAEGLRPGFRSASGVVLTKAWVAVNRGGADEPARH